MTLYTVQKGDSLWKIARRHNIGLDSLIAANPQLNDPNSILVGQQINLPCLWEPAGNGNGMAAEGPEYPFCDQPGAGRPCIYVASQGETLESISQSFMTPLTHMAYFNMGYGKREALPQGARIVIPGESSEPPHYPPHYMQNGMAQNGMAQNGMAQNGMAQSNWSANTEPWGAGLCSRSVCRSRRG